MGYLLKRKFILFRLFYLSLSIGLVIPAQAQVALNLPSSSDSLSSLADRLVYIDNIFLTGNKKTKDRIILRELSFKKGESYPFSVLENLLKLDREKIYNTRLFNTVEVGFIELDITSIDIVVDVTERWYLFPIPIIDIIDRNFNDWWVNQNADLSRIIYGLSLYHFNMRGMNERMTITAQFGYSRRYEFQYDIPYIDQSQRNGLGMFVKYIEYTNLHYNNFDNLRYFIDTDEVTSGDVLLQGDLLKTNVFTGINYVRRNSFYTRHRIDLNFSHSQIADTIIALNPNYHGIAGNTQQYFSLSYNFSVDKRDIAAYPLDGYKVEAQVEKLGLGFFNDVDITNIRARYARFITLPKGFYLSNYTSVYLSTPNNQPYSTLQGIGFGNDVVRGYELYVIHGQNYVVNKTSFKKVLLAGNAQMKNFPLEQFKHVPYAFYLKTYFDIGYAKNTFQYEGNEFLADKLIYGGGLGLDIVTMYDIVIRLEYSVNSIGESGFFFNIISEF